MNSSRRDFLAKSGIGALSIMIPSAYKVQKAPKGKRVGIIGLDTSHSVEFTKMLNAENPEGEMEGYKVVVAYPHGSRDIASSTERIPGYTEEVKKLGVEIVDSIGDLLGKVDVVLLETNDGRLHLEQATEVINAGKRVFIDKPVAASYDHARQIYSLAKQKNIPIFSSSSLRYIAGVEKIKDGKVLGAETYSPAKIEKTHPDLVWYGIHGVEMLFTVMGTGCQEVVRVHSAETDVVVGRWAGGRIGVFRGMRNGQGYGGTVFMEKENIPLGPYKGYKPLLKDIIHYFSTGQVPVSPEETLEIFAFMEAADESKKNKGVPVKLRTS